MTQIASNMLRYAANCGQNVVFGSDFPLLMQVTLMSSILVLNGPNLNLLGSREPNQYGHRTLEEIMEELTRFAGACGHQLDHVQENSEGVLVEAVHKAAHDGVDYIIYQPGGLYAYQCRAEGRACWPSGFPLLKYTCLPWQPASLSGRFLISQTSRWVSSLAFMAKVTCWPCRPSSIT